MIREFEEYYFSQHELSLEKFKDNVQSFDAVWVELSKKHGGTKIKSTRLIELFSSLKKPLGNMLLIFTPFLTFVKK